MSIVETQSKKSIRKIKAKNSFNDLPTISNVVFNKTLINFHLSDKRIISIPLDWIAKLKNATKEDREKYTLRGHFIFWDDIDEIIGVKNLLNGSIVPK